MGPEATQTGDETKVWLTDGEIEDLWRAAASYRDNIIIQLGAFVEPLCTLSDGFVN